MVSEGYESSGCSGTGTALIVSLRAAAVLTDIIFILTLYRVYQAESAILQKNVRWGILYLHDKPTNAHL